MWYGIDMRITLLIGMPGSGKTTYGEALAKKSDAIFYDDFSKFHCINSIKFAEEIIIADICFCDAAILKEAESKLLKKFPDSEITKLYFKNQPDRCRANVLKRSDGRHVEPTIKKYERSYSPPIDAIDVWDGALHDRTQN